MIDDDGLFGLEETGLLVVNIHISLFPFSPFPFLTERGNPTPFLPPAPGPGPLPPKRAEIIAG